MVDNTTVAGFKWALIDTGANCEPLVIEVVNVEVHGDSLVIFDTNDEYYWAHSSRVVLSRTPVFRVTPSVSCETSWVDDDDGMPI